MTAPITPDERAAMRKRAERLHHYGGESQEASEDILAALDALDTAEAKARLVETYLRMEREAARRNLGRAEKAEAEVARLLAERTAAHADDATCASCTHEYVADLERRVEEAEAARPAPVWDEDTVTEAARRAVAGVVVNVSNWPDGAQAGLLGRDLSAPIDAITAAALAVMREHLPVKPGREDIYRAWHGTDEPWGGCADAEGVGRVLDLWPGESRATVQAEALREFARSINLEELGNEWEGDDPDLANDLRWAASNAASTVQMGLYARADRLDPRGADRD